MMESVSTWMVAPIQVQLAAVAELCVVKLQIARYIYLYGNKQMQGT